MLFSRVKTLADERGENIKTVATKLGFSENAFYKWKTQSPKSDTIEKVADYFNVSTDYLLGRTDNKYIHTDIETIAAHHVDEDWTEEELEEIERFKEFVKMKRNQR